MQPTRYARSRQTSIHRKMSDGSRIHVWVGRGPTGTVSFTYDHLIDDSEDAGWQSTPFQACDLPFDRAKAARLVHKYASSIG